MTDEIIGHCPGNNLLIHENFHIAVDGKGIVTVLHDNLASAASNVGRGPPSRFAEDQRNTRPRADPTSGLPTIRTGSRDLRSQ